MSLQHLLKKLLSSQSSVRKRRSLKRSAVGNRTTEPLEERLLLTVPVASDDYYDVPTADGLTIDAASGVLANDSDAENDPLTASIFSGPQHGTVTLDPDGAFTYSPNAGYLGTDSFTYTADEASGSSTPATVHVGVPDDTFYVEQNSMSALLPVHGNDPSGAMIAAVSTPTYGSAFASFDSAIGQEAIDYSPAGGTPDSFTYDNSGSETATRSVRVHLHAEDDDLSTARSTTGNGSIYSSGGFIGDGSYGNGDVDFFEVTLSAGEQIQVDIDAAALDTGGSLGVLDAYLRVFDSFGQEVAVNDNGVDPQTGLATNDPFLTFTAALSDTYFVAVSDHYNTFYDPNMPGYGSSYTTGAYLISIQLPGQSSNAPPSVSLSNLTNTIAEDTSTTNPIHIADINVTDDGTGNNVLSLSGPDAALFSISGTQLVLSAGSNLDFESKQQLQVTVNVDDSAVGSSPDDSATVTVNITDVNEPPTVALQNTVTAISETADTTNRTPVADIVITDDALGSETLSLSGNDAGLFEIDSGVLYLVAGATLDQSTNPDLSVEVRVDDPTLGSSHDDSASLNITVTTGSSTPGLSIADVSVSEGIGHAQLTVTLSASSSQVVTVSYTTENGSAVANSDYTATSGTLTIPAGSTSGQISVPIIDDSDTENAETFDVVLSSPVHASLSDDRGTVTISASDAAGGNQTPVAVSDSYSVYANTVLTINSLQGLLLNDTDADGDPLTAQLHSGPSHGILTLYDNGSFELDPESFTGTITFQYTATDGTATSAPATVTIDVSGSSGADGPNVADDLYFLDANSSLTVDAPGVLANERGYYYQVDAELISGPSHGVLEYFNVDGSFRYTPNSDFIGLDSFTYRAFDGYGGSNAKAWLTVEGEVVVAPNDPLAVNSTQDNVSGAATLRNALFIANTQAGPDTIIFDLPPENRVITLSADDPLIIDSEVTIVGPQDGSPLTIVGTSGRIFEIQSNAMVAISDLMLSGGSSVGNGGAIRNEGVLNLDRVTIANSTAQGNGGALHNVTGAELNLRLSTISGNTATDAGGLLNEGIAFIQSATITANHSATGIGGIVSAVAAQTTISNTIVAANTNGPEAGDTGGIFTTGGTNLIGRVGSATGFSESAGDLLGGTQSTGPIDPILGPLQYNGGAADTHLPLPGSPAIDRGQQESGTVLDQRRADRVLDGVDATAPLDEIATSDIGSVEFGTYFVTTSEDLVDHTPLGDGLVDADGSTSAVEISLRAAVNEFSAIHGAYDASGSTDVRFEAVIGFRPGIDIAQLTLNGTQEDDGHSGDLDVYGNLTVRGRAATQTSVNGGSFDYPGMINETTLLNDRIFHVHADSRLRLDRISVTGGKVVDDGNAYSGVGAGIFNDGGTVELTHATIGIGPNIYPFGVNSAEVAGGGIYSRNGVVHLADGGIVSGNLAKDGGGLYIESGSLVMDAGSIVSDNVGERFGGGLYLQDGLATLTSAEFTLNEMIGVIDETGVPKAAGTGMYLAGGTAVIVDSLIHNNVPSLMGTGGGFDERVEGGGIYNAATLDVSGTVFKRNGDYEQAGTAATNGAAIFNVGEATIRNSEFRENDAAWGHGGAIYNATDANVLVEDSLFHANTINYEHLGLEVHIQRGGAIYNHRGTVAIYRSTFTDHLLAAGDSFGGAIMNHNGSMKIVESEFRGNDAYGFGGAILNYDLDATLTVVSSTFENNESVAGGGAIANQFGTVNIHYTHFTDNNSLYEATYAGDRFGGGAIAHYGHHRYFEDTSESAIELAAAIGPEQRLIFVKSLAPLAGLTFPAGIVVNKERMTVVATDEFLQALIVTRNSGTQTFHPVDSVIRTFVSAAQTQITVGDPAQIAQYALPLDLLLSSTEDPVSEIPGKEEVVTVTKIVGNVLHVERGRNGTEAVDHAYPIKVWGIGGGLQLSQSTLIGNRATGSGLPEATAVQSDAPQHGGALLNQLHPYAPVSVVEGSSFAWNTSEVGGAIWTGIENEYTFEMLASVSLPALPAAPADAAGLFLQNSIVAKSITPLSFPEVSADISGRVHSGGSNFISSGEVTELDVLQPAFGGDATLHIAPLMYPDDGGDPVQFEADARSLLPATPFLLHAVKTDAPSHQYDLVPEFEWIQVQEVVVEPDGSYLLTTERGYNGTVRMALGPDTPGQVRLLLNANGFWTTEDHYRPRVGADYTFTTTIPDGGSLSAQDTEIEVLNSANLPPAPFEMEIQSLDAGQPQLEYVLVTHVDGNLLTVVRAQQETAAVAHVDDVSLSFAVRILDELEPQLGLRVDPRTGQPTAIASPDSLLLDAGVDSGLPGHAVRTRTALAASFEVRSPIYMEVSDPPQVATLVSPVYHFDDMVMVTDATTLPTVPFFLRLNDEVMQVTEVTGNQLKVVRARFGTAVAEHDLTTEVIVGTELNSTSDRLNVGDVSSLPTVPFLIELGSEILSVSEVEQDRNTLTVSRAQFGSTALSLTGGEVFTHGQLVHAEASTPYPSDNFPIRLADELALVTAQGVNGYDLLRIERGIYRTTPAEHRMDVVGRFGEGLSTVGGHGRIEILTSDLTAAETSLELPIVAAIPTTPFQIRIGDEDLRVEEVTLGTTSMMWTVVRALNGTVPSHYSAGSSVVLLTDGFGSDRYVDSNGNEQRTADPGSIENVIFFVNSIGAETDQAPGDGVVTTTVPGEITLRAAIAEANALAAPATIVLPAGDFSLTPAAGASQQLHRFIVDTHLTLIGDSPYTTRLLGSQDRLFEVLPGASLTIHSLTLQDGTSDQEGGAITATDSEVILEDVVITSSNATSGGAISITNGRLSVISSTLHGNSASADGGAISARSSIVIVHNSTLSGNSAGQSGGGLYADESSAITMTQATVTLNTAPLGGALVADGDLRIGNSLLQNNTSSAELDVVGLVESEGGNLVGRRRPAVTSLSAAIAPSDNSMIVDDILSLPDTPFYAALHSLHSAQYEAVRVDQIIDQTLIIQRGMAGTLATSHDTGEQLRVDGFWAALDRSGTPAAPFTTTLSTLADHYGSTPTHQPTATGWEFDQGNDANASVGIATTVLDLSFTGSKLLLDGPRNMPAVPFIIRIGGEHLRVVDVDGPVLTVERDVLRSIYGPFHHFAGSPVQIFSDQRGATRQPARKIVSEVGGQSSETWVRPDIGSYEWVHQYSVTTSHSAVTEGSVVNEYQDVQYTITRSGLTDTASMLHYHVLRDPQNSVEADDFKDGIVPSGTIHFEPGETTAVVTVSIRKDFAVETDEVFHFVIDRPMEPALLLNDRVSTTILNDDIAEVTVVNPVVDEGLRLTFELRLDNAVEDGFLISWATSDITATAAEDYNAGSGRIFFSGTTGESHLVTIQTTEDDVVERDELFGMNLGWLWSAAGIDSDVTLATGITGTIRNDDQTDVIVRSVRLIEGDSGLTSFVVDVDVTPRPVDVPFTVDLTTTSGTAAAGSDFVATTHSLAFTGIANQRLTLPFDVSGDDDHEPDEVFNLELTGLVAAGRESGITLIDGTATILNDDGPSVIVLDATVTEADNGDQYLVFDVLLNEPVGPVTVDVTAIANTADSSDFEPKTDTLTFSGIHGEVQQFSVKVHGDQIVELDETLTILLSNLDAGGNESDYELKNGIGTIINDDAAVVDVIVPAGIHGATSDSHLVGREGSPFTYHVRLSEAVDHSVSVIVQATIESGSSPQVVKLETLTFAGVKDEVRIFAFDIPDDGATSGIRFFSVEIVDIANHGRNVSRGSHATGEVHDPLPPEDPPCIPMPLDPETGEPLFVDPATGEPLKIVPDDYAGDPLYGDRRFVERITYPLIPDIPTWLYNRGYQPVGLAEAYPEWNLDPADAVDFGVTEFEFSAGTFTAPPPVELSFTIGGETVVEVDWDNANSYYYVTVLGMPYEGIEPLMYLFDGYHTPFTLGEPIYIPAPSGGWTDTPTQYFCPLLETPEPAEPDPHEPERIIQADWVVQMGSTDGIVLNPFPNFDYRRAHTSVTEGTIVAAVDAAASPELIPAAIAEAAVSGSSNVDVAVTITKPNGQLAVIGEVVTLGFGTITVNGDSTLTYRPLDPELLKDREDNELLPETDDNDDAIRYTGLEDFQAHIVDLTLIDAPDPTDPDPDRFLSSKPIQIAISNQQAILRGDRYHRPDGSINISHHEVDIEGTDETEWKIVGIRANPDAPEPPPVPVDQVVDVKTHTFEFDGPLYTEQDSVYRINLDDVFKDVDGGNELKIVALEGEEGFFSKSFKAKLGEIDTVDSYGMEISSSEKFMTIKKVGDRTIEVTNPLTNADVQPTGSNRVWDRTGAAIETFVRVVFTDGQKVRAPKADDGSDRANLPVLHALNLYIRPNNFSTRSQWSAPSHNVRPWVTRIKGSVPSDLQDSSIYVTPISRTSSVADSAVAEIADTTVDLETGTFQRRHALFLDGSGGTSDLAIPGIVYDSATVQPTTGTGNAVAQARIRGLSGVASVAATLRWFNHTNTDGTTGGRVVVSTKTFNLPATGSGDFLLSMRPEEAPTVSGLYNWEMELIVTRGSGDVTIVAGGQTSVIVNSTVTDSEFIAGSPRPWTRHNLFGNGWHLDGIPSLLIDEGGDDGTLDDRAVLWFPGSAPQIFDAGPLTLNDYSYSGTFNSLQHGSSAIGNEGFADPSQFGQLTSQNSGEHEIVYDNGFGLRYVFKRHQIHPDPAPAEPVYVYEIDRIEQPGASFDASATTNPWGSTRPGLQFEYEVNAALSIYPQLRKIISSDGTTTQFTFDGTTGTIETLDGGGAALRTVNYLLDADNNLIAIDHPVDALDAAAVPSTTTVRRSFEYNDRFMEFDRWLAADGTIRRQTKFESYAPGSSQSRLLKTIRKGGVGTDDAIVFNIGSAAAAGLAGSALQNVDEVIAYYEQEIDSLAIDGAGVESSTAGQSRIVHQLSPEGWTTAITRTFATPTLTTPISRDEFTRDVVGRIKSHTDPNGAKTYHWYDYESLIDEKIDAPDDAEATKAPRFDPTDARGNVIFSLTGGNFSAFEYETDNETEAAHGRPLRSMQFANITPNGVIFDLAEPGFDVDAAVLEREKNRLKKLQGTTTIYDRRDDGQLNYVWTVRGEQDEEVDSGTSGTATDIRKPDDKEVADQADHYESWTYTNGRIGTYLDARGLKTTYEYDDGGRLTKTTAIDKGADPEDSADDEELTSVFTYDDLGFPATSTEFHVAESSGVYTRTNTTYDQYGRLLRQQLEDNHKLLQDVINIYDSDGAIAERVNAGVRTINTRDSRGLLQQTDQAYGSTFHVVQTGAPESITQTTTYEYCSDGSLKKQVRPDLVAVRHYRDIANRKQWVSTDRVSNGPHSVLVDGSIDLNLSGVQIIEHEYDKFGRPIRSINLMTGGKAEQEPPVFGMGLPVSSSSNGKNSRTADHQRMLDARGLTIKSQTDGFVGYGFSTDEFGNRTQVQDLDGRQIVSHSSFAPAGDIYEFTHRRGVNHIPTATGQVVTTKYSRDQQGRIRQIVDPLISSSPAATSSSSSSSASSSSTPPTGPTRSSGPTDTDVAAETGAAPATTKYEIDSAAGYRKTVSTSRDGQVTTQWQDGLGRIVKEQNSLGDVTERIYDLAGNLVTQKFTPADASGQLRERTTNYVYDGLNRLRRTVEVGSAALGEATFHTAVDYRQQNTYSWPIPSTIHYLPEPGDGPTAGVVPDTTGTETWVDGLGNPIFIRRPANTAAGEETFVRLFTYDYYDTDPFSSVGGFDLPIHSSFVTTVRDGLAGSSPLSIDGSYPHTRVSRTVQDMSGHTTVELVRVDNFEMSDSVQSATTLEEGGFEVTLINEYDEHGQHLRTVDAHGNSSWYTYDSYGNVTETLRPDGSTVVSIYNSLGQLLQETNNVGRRIRYDYDALGRKVRTTTPLHVTRSTTYSGQTTTHQESWGGLAGMASAVLNTTVVTFDPTTGERTTTDPLGNVVTEKLGADGQVLSLTDARGRTTKFFYDRFNRLIRTELPLSLATEATYDLRGNAETQTNELGQVTQTQYDSLGQVRFVTAPSGTITERTYDVSGNVMTEETSYTSSGPGDRPDLNRLTTWTYTPRNQVETQTVDPAGLNLTTTTTYDAVGNVETVTDPYGNTTTFEYDSLNRRTKVIDPLGHATTTQYPNFGMDQVVTDHLNKVTTTSLDNDGNVIKVEDAEGGLTIYTRDGFGYLLEIEDPVGNVTTFTYDALHRIKSVENELGDRRRFYYDPNGNTELQVDRNGRVTWFEYDDLNRRIHERWMGSPVIPESGPTAAFDPAAAERTLSFTYDALGRITSAVDPSASYTYDSYDVTGGLKDSTATLNGLTTTVRQTASFNAVGQRLSLNLLLNGTADVLNSYAYDAAGRTTTVTQQDGGAGSVQWKQLGFEYDLENSDPDISHQSRITRLITDATNVVAVTTADYDKASRLTSLQHAAGSTTLAGYGYTYDAINRITQIDSATDGLATFGYDKIDQLTSADFTTQSNESYTYDQNGNRTNSGYSTSGNNRLVSDGTYNYEYDAEGNRTKRTTVATGAGDQPVETVDYTWDYHNRLTHLTFTDASGSLTRQIWYEYDVFDRRVSKTIDSTGDGTSNYVEHYVYEDSPTSDLDGIAVIFTDEDGAAGPESSAVSNRLFHGPDVDQVFADENALSEVLWNLTDHQGTVRDIVEYDDSTSTTEVVKHVKYGAFGNIDSVEDGSGSAIPNGESEIHFGYTGREWDDDAGLYYYRARWYDAVAGRFISEDPLGFEAGDTNLNRYVGNNAWNATDPSGLKDSAISRWAKQYVQDPIRALIGAPMQKIGKSTQTLAKKYVEAPLKTGVKEPFEQYVAPIVTGAAQGVQTTVQNVHQPFNENVAPILRGAAHGVQRGATHLADNSTFGQIHTLHETSTAYRLEDIQRGDTLSQAGYMAGYGGVRVLQTVAGGYVLAPVAAPAATTISAVPGASTTIALIGGGAAADIAVSQGTAAYYAYENGDILEAQDHLLMSAESTVAAAGSAIYIARQAGGVFASRYSTQPNLTSTTDDLLALRLDSGYDLPPQGQSARAAFDGRRGVRNSRALTSAEYDDILRYMDELGVQEGRDVVLGETLRTGLGPGDVSATAYSDEWGRVFVFPDVYPGPTAGGPGPTSVIPRMSMRATMAHEVVGHLQTTERRTAHLGGSLLDEVQASVRAAHRAPGLTQVERIQLLRDAAERVKLSNLRNGTNIRLRDLRGHIDLD